MQHRDVRTNAAASPASVKPFQIRGRFFTAVALRLDTGVDDAFFAALDAHISQAPAFFDDAPMVLDFENVAKSLPKAEVVRLIEIDVVDYFRSHNKYTVVAWRDDSGKPAQALR